MWISDFIRSFVQTSDAPDASATVAFYAEEAWVLGRMQSREQIRLDVSEYNQRWPIRRDSINGDIDVVMEEPEQQYLATYVQSFYTENAGPNLHG